MKIKNTNPKTPIDGILFEEVGEKFGIGKTLTQKYYSTVKRFFEARLNRHPYLFK
jgi:hypothetical protein